MLKNMKKSTKSNLITLGIVVGFYVLIQILGAVGVLTNSFSGQLVPICAYVILAVSLNLTVGILGELSLGHAGFMSVGAFSGTLAYVVLSENAPQPLAMLVAFVVGGVVAGLFGVLVGIPVLRLSGDYLAIVTLAFGEIVKNVMNACYLGLDSHGLHFSLKDTASLNMEVDGKVLINGAMGITGTDVAKGAADMTLTDDNFATIVSAVGEGRRIYDNIRKAIQFLLASNMSEVLGVFFATLLGFTLLNPVHLLFINLITDCFPALALGLEQAEPDTMTRPPRDSRDGVFAGGLGVDLAYQGVLITLITLVSYIIGHCMEVGYFEMPKGVSDDGMTMAFLTMSMCEIFHSFNMRSQRKSVFSLPSHNKVLWAAMAGSLVLTTAVLEVPVLANAFGFTPVSWPEYGIALALAFLVIPVVELVKLCQRRAAARRAQK